MAQNLTKTTRSTRARKNAAKPVQDDAVQLFAVETIADEFTELMAALGEAPDVITVQPTPASADSDEVLLDSALAELDASVAAAEAVEDAAELSLEALEAVVVRAEATELMMATATPEGVTEGLEGAAPTGGPVAGATEKKERAPRKYYSDKVERLKARVGEKLVEYSVLTTADVVADEEALKQVMEQTLEIIRKMNSKEKNRASNLIEFLSGKRSKLNEVLERVLRVLERDGYVQTGNEGNVMKDLLARPYSPASARAMGGNTIGMYADLKLIVPVGKGRFEPNPDSLLLQKARTMLGFGAAAAV